MTLAKGPRLRRTHAPEDLHGELERDCVAHLHTEMDCVVHPHMEIAWHDFLTWAIQEPGMRQAYEASSGKSLEGAPLDRLVDAATGNLGQRASAQTLFRFAQWATIHHFGLDSAPAAFRTACEADPYPYGKAP